VSFTLITETHKDMLKILKALLLQKKQIQQPAQILASTPALVKTPEEWKAHWQAQGQEWRTGPEISTQRQDELAQHRIIEPDVEQGIYPFKDIPLTRADIEWLLATHENGRGPVDWSDEHQRQREGLDLRGAVLRGEGEKHFVDLTYLPLSQLIGTLGMDEWYDANEQQRSLAVIHLEGANLTGAHLEGARLMGAHLEGAFLWKAHFQKANLWWTHLEGAFLWAANLEEAHLSEAHLEGAQLNRANLQRAYLREANLEGAYLNEAHLEGTDLSGACLEGADLTSIIFADEKYVGPKVVDVQWEGSNIAVVEWSQITILDDEHEARQKWMLIGGKKHQYQRLNDYKTAVRANRQLAVVLQSQGLNEDVARFTYRARVLQKEVLWFSLIQDNIPVRTRLSLFGAWLFSWFMFLIAGYGYRFGRTFLTYLAVISGFAALYYSYGVHDILPHNKSGPHHLSWYEAFVVSLTAFHGRGFFVGTFSPGDPQALVAAIEAFLGLLIEVIFIATLTRRLFTQ